MDILTASREIFGEAPPRRPRVHKPHIRAPDDVEGAGDVDAPLPQTCPDNVRRAARRARGKVREYALCNKFNYFVTFTLDSRKIDRYDVDIITKRLNQWLGNHVARHGLRYLMIPEYHKDRAIHYHGLIDDSLPLVDSGTVIPAGGGRPRRPRNQRARADLLAAGGKPVYNLPAWGYGYSTAVPLDGDYQRTVNYVCKYITKAVIYADSSTCGKVGGRWYYHSNNLRGPERRIMAWDIGEAMAYGGKLVDIPEAALSIAYLTLPANVCQGVTLDTDSCL